MTLDLGTFDEPVLLFGGPYSNLQATEALIAAANRHGIPAERAICTGDVVAYCANPAETVAAVRDWGCHVVMGNCEESLGQGGADCKCGFEKGSECDLLAVRWYSHANAAMDDDARAWMAALPHPVTFTLSGLRFAVVHGHERDISEWVFASTPESEKRAALDQLGVDGVIAGHSGLPFSEVLGDGRLWHNPGVIGMPANDGTQRVWYSVLTPVADGLRVSHHALDYDVETAHARMIETNMPGPYADNMLDGIWPNQDLLPATERAQKGSPISEETLLWQPRRAAVA